MVLLYIYPARIFLQLVTFVFSILKCAKLVGNFLLRHFYFSFSTTICLFPISMLYALATGVRNECRTKDVGFSVLKLFIFFAFSYIDYGVSFAYMFLSMGS